MKTYLGVKLVNAEPMTLGDYNEYRGWTIPANEDPKREGYVVHYADGYVSWCPKESFEEANREVTGLSFGHAIEAMKMGKAVTRAGWNGKGMFLFIRPGDRLPVSMIPGIKSLPQVMKDWVQKWTGGDTKFAGGADISLTFTPYICMKAANSEIVNGWLASQTDMLSDDWMIVE